MCNKWKITKWVPTLLKFRKGSTKESVDRPIDDLGVSSVSKDAVECI